MLPNPPAQPAPSPAPRAVGLAQALNSLQEARRLDLGEAPAPAALRARAEALGPVAETLAAAYGPKDPRVLLALGLQAGLRARAGDLSQEAPWARLAGLVHQELQALARRRGPAHSALLPWLDALAALLQVQDLEARPWRERALALRIAQARKADPELERGCAEAVAHHYGPWLGFRPPDLPEVQAWTSRLLNLWALERDPDARARRVAAVAFESQTFGLWRLLGRRGAPELAARIRALLDGLSAAALREEAQGLTPWVNAQQGGPWEAAANGLAERVDRALAADPGPGPVLARIGLLLARGEPGRAAALLREALLDPVHGQDPRYLGAAERVLRAGPDPALRDLALGRMLHPATPPDAERLRAWAELLEAGGDLIAAEALHRRHLALDPAAARPLARNLRAQGRLEEAWGLLEGLRAAAEPAPPLDLLMELLDLARARGDSAVAGTLARRAVALWAEEGARVRLVPGLALAVDSLDQGLTPREAALLQGLLDPSGQAPGPEARATLLRALRAQEPPAPWRQGPEAARVLDRAIADLDRAGQLATRDGIRLRVGTATLRAGEDPEAGLAVMEALLAAAEGVPDLRPLDWAYLRSSAGAVAFMAGREREGESLLLGALEAAESVEALDTLDDETFDALAAPALHLWERCLEGRRFEAAGALLARLGRLRARPPAEPADRRRAQETQAELDRMAAHLQRVARLQGLLEAAGLP